jgi:hypothetical protein
LYRVNRRRSTPKPRVRSPNLRSPVVHLFNNKIPISSIFAEGKSGDFIIFVHQFQKAINEGFKKD